MPVAAPGLRPLLRRRGSGVATASGEDLTSPAAASLRPWPARNWQDVVSRAVDTVVWAVVGTGHDLAHNSEEPGNDLLRSLGKHLFLGGEVGLPCLGVPDLHS